MSIQFAQHLLLKMLSCYFILLFFKSLSSVGYIFFESNVEFYEFICICTFLVGRILINVLISYFVMFRLFVSSWFNFDSLDESRNHLLLFHFPT